MPGRSPALRTRATHGESLTAKGVSYILPIRWLASRQEALDQFFQLILGRVVDLPDPAMFAQFSD